MLFRSKQLTHFSDGDDYRLVYLFPVYEPSVVETAGVLAPNEESMLSVRF